MSSNKRLRILAALTLLMLTSCGTFGPALVEPAVDLPPIPADLKPCLARQVGAPPAGSLSKRQLFKLIADLKASADDKQNCGERLAAWYEDIASGYAAAGK